MEKFKIAVKRFGKDAAGDDIFQQVCDDPAMMELCTFCGEEDKSADAQVLVPSAEPVKCPADAIEIIVTAKTNFMPIAQEPTAEDIIRLRDIMERDFDLRLPRIAIVQESPMQNPDLANQVTAEQGINTYGPYKAEQIIAENQACHFDCIIIPEGSDLVAKLSPDVSVRFFAGRELVVTAVWPPAQKKETEDGLADVSAWTHPIYTAIDIVRNRARYDEARQNPLPKLYHDKREDRRKDNAQQASDKAPEPSSQEE